jgi:hypothetical protein
VNFLFGRELKKIPQGTEGIRSYQDGRSVQERVAELQSKFCFLNARKQSSVRIYKLPLSFEDLKVSAVTTEPVATYPILV